MYANLKNLPKRDISDH